MSDLVTLTGMVLSAIPVGDFDKRVVVLTKERGKITAFAKGARRQNSGLLAAASPFCFGLFSFYEGRTSYTMSQAEVQNYFRELIEDFEGAYFGFYFLEMADYYTRENNDEMAVLKLLYASLRALTNKNLNQQLIRRIYELKMMVLNGEYPEFFRCVKCGREEELVVFAAEAEGLVCSRCTAGIRGGIPLSESTVYTLQYIVSSPIEKLYSFTVSDEVMEQLELVIERLRKKYIDKKFKSLDILRNISIY